MPSYPGQKLDSIDRFIGIARDIANNPVLAMPQHRAMAEDLYQIANKLLIANENMVRWLNRFLYFDFRDADARAKFLELIQDYRGARAGSVFHNMKWNCGDIWLIYQRHIAGNIDAMFQEDRQSAEEAKHAFDDLSNADEGMVTFIYNTVVGNIEGFIHDAEHHIDRSDVNLAETRRLAFKVASAELSKRLERFAGELADLVLQYARLAERPVTLT
ncbi:hypothetical protein [Nonomuraea sp. NPDC049400]|uniref:hypothetical protein n=1 Tax=Nonomuraea sp. NPDC049400 TaxID=3364352 RepID=UPI0037AD02D7